MFSFKPQCWRYSDVHGNSKALNGHFLSDEKHFCWKYRSENNLVKHLLTFQKWQCAAFICKSDKTSTFYALRWTIKVSFFRFLITDHWMRFSSSYFCILITVSAVFTLKSLEFLLPILRIVMWRKVCFPMKSSSMLKYFLILGYFAFFIAFTNQLRLAKFGFLKKSHYKNPLMAKWTVILKNNDS